MMELKWCLLETWEYDSIVGGIVRKSSSLLSLCSQPPKHAVVGTEMCRLEVFVFSFFTPVLFKTLLLVLDKNEWWLMRHWNIRLLSALWYVPAFLEAKHNNWNCMLHFNYMKCYTNSSVTCTLDKDFSCEHWLELQRFVIRQTFLINIFIFLEKGVKLLIQYPGLLCFCILW